MWKVEYPTETSPGEADEIAVEMVQASAMIVSILYDCS